MVLGPHTSRGNIPRHIEKIVDFNVALIRHMREQGYSRVEARSEEAAKWLAQVVEVNKNRLAGKDSKLADGRERQRSGPTEYSRAGLLRRCDALPRDRGAGADGGYKELVFR